MKILWLSNAPWAPSGYGQQTALFCPRLVAAGHDLAILCNYGLQGQESLWEGIPCCPGDGNWGNRAMGTFASRYDADLVVALCDAWVLTPGRWPEGPPVLNWAPVDHQPAPPAVVSVLAHERVRPAAMSRFGLEQLQAAGLDPFRIPHGIDTTVFRPRPELRDQVRDELGVPRDAFLAGMVAANQGLPVSRKAFPQAFLAFSRFAAKRSDAWLYVHTDPSPIGGLPLDPLAEACRIPKDRFRFPDPVAFEVGYPTGTVAALYQAFDVLLMPSMGEGFGIPLLEAQACGVPVITSDHSAMPELVGGGWLVTGDPWWNATQNSFLLSPSVAAIEAALEEAYQAVGDQSLREAAVKLARGYDADLIMEEHWKPVLEALTAPQAAGKLAAVSG